MGPAQAIRTCLFKSFQYSGRATRPEYWWFAAFWIIAPELVGFAFAFPVGFVYGLQLSRGAVNLPPPSLLWPLWATLGSWLLLCLPGLAVTFRRLHDCRLSGWWILLIPATALLSCLALVLILDAVLHASSQEVFNTGKLIGANLRYFLMFSALPLMALLTRASQAEPTTDTLPPPIE